MATSSGWSAVVSSATAVINYPHQRSILKELTASPASPECLPVTVPLSPLEPCLCVPRCLEPSSDSLCVPLLPSGDPFDTLDPWTRAWQLSWFQNLPRDAVEDTHWLPEFPDSPLRCFASISWTPRLAVEPLRCVSVAPEPTCPFSAALPRLFLDPLRDRDPGHTQLPSKIQIQPPPMNHCCLLQLIPWTRPPSHTLIIVYLNKSLKLILTLLSCVLHVG
ncbi:uncharacterized protein LOC116729834 [Xiphophorus hellerii]|uniref:uncharacterized protein LOC116729834 n=1 Tax=Xiphophorus hellerii TaxID=8084 RepID=UPI0013B40E99|nr:uncharacterized protein LOC116729834 [Xiphophorus hellerii]